MPATKQLPDDDWKAIADAADDLRSAERQVEKLRGDLDRLFVAAMRNGGQIEAIANAAGVSRQTVYKAAGRSS